jgi:hypothetical protein
MEADPRRTVQLPIKPISSGSVLREIGYGGIDGKIGIEQYQ